MAKIDELKALAADLRKRQRQVDQLTRRASERDRGFPPQARSVHQRQGSEYSLPGPGATNRTKTWSAGGGKPKRRHALAGCQLLQRCGGQYEGDQAGRVRRLKPTQSNPGAAPAAGAGRQRMSPGQMAKEANDPERSSTGLMRMLQPPSLG